MIKKKKKKNIILEKNLDRPKNLMMKIKIISDDKKTR